MKKVSFLTSILMFILLRVNAQMGVNKDGSAPHSSAMLDIKASATTNAKGLLMPRVADHTVITSPATGLMVFNTTTNTFWYYNGLAWTDMGNGGSSGAWLQNGTNVYTNNNKVGVNTATPQTSLDIKGDGFLVSQKTKLTTDDPNLNVYNMPLSNVTYTNAAGILYDPSGPIAPYPSGTINTTTTIYTYVPDVIGIKLTFEAFDTEANGDSIIIMNGAGTTIVKYSGNALPPDFFYNGSLMQIKFKTNGNSTVGQGFKIKWQRVDKDGAGVTINGVIGNSAYFDASRGAFRSGNLGQYSTETIGNNSVAMGFANRASGDASVAMGSTNNALGIASVAMGTQARASGTSSTAVGYNARATGDYSLALGNNNLSSGNNSVTIGSANNAIGSSSTAFGGFTNATNTYSTTFGVGTTASGYTSTAFGYYSTASGGYSVAFGSSSRASGDYSTAMNYYTNASSTYSFASGVSTISGGYASTAMGNNTNASGYSATALGNQTNASGYNATAMGTNSIASGFSATAMGYNTSAVGNNSTSMGNNSYASSEGSFVIGDSPNGSSTIYSSNTNSLSTRFRGGYYLYTSANLGSGAILFGGNNSWSSISDSTKKENFLPIDGENVLKKIANMRTVTWNYKGQDPKLFRHYGPMAQEFFSAFGRDKLGVIGNDTTIASADFDGINFTAIKALEKRTAELQKENESLRKRLAILEKSSSEISILKAEMEQLKAILLPEKEKISVKNASDK
jgi:hypothetical protein